ncbi:kinase-like domain-containing protein [Aspergillus pseudonomiae]|uniref:Altered inheritance of mitochondria protein 9, mitochondrial n=1 Tax=Aspergillus pseudonomiae TaxID=1506151 RepID=A0A5N7D7N9_9EURO|nr:kinase-like domain-containing protein [Aspergillus pseudonomiae]KAE8402309.1 kinase-like domain-containing protein [Aspergillus pseudonomiae]
MQALRNILKLRSLRPNPSPKSMLVRRQLSIECRGNPISKEDLFKYTNGRFLAAEDIQFSKRYVRFNIDRLCDVITSLSGSERAPVSKIEKLEGGFSKALLMTTEDGCEYIAKIPCPNAGRPMYCTESEVAVLNFIRTYTTIPVPKVLAWSSDMTNAVGAEYIVMERVPGVQIFKKWDEMGESNRISLIKRLTQWERELSEIQFPAYGNLYYKNSLGDPETIPLESSIDPKGEFCIGPSCDPSWLIQPGDQLLPGVRCGPWRTLGDMGESLIERSLSRTGQDPNTQLPASLYGSTEDHFSLLHMAKEAMPTVANNSKLLEKSQPILWHSDLHMGNIFVSEDDPGKVTGFIDWQNTSISPLFLQVRWPVFLNPPEDYQEGLVMPGLPSGFEDMDDDKKELALYSKAKATWTKAYEVASYLNNRKSWQGMQVPSPLKEIFRRCGETWDEGLVPLRETVIEIFLSQKDLGFPSGILPVHFTDEQIARHKQEFYIYQEWHEMRKFVKEVLDTDDEGWIPPERDLGEMKTRNKMLFEYYISKMAPEKPATEVKNIWPFPLDT